MSTTRSLTKFYGSFFLNCAKFSVCPYTITINAFIKNQNNPKPEEIVVGVGMCLFLSVVVPILPSITSLTFALAVLGASLGLASMFLTYPIALLMDAVDTSPQPAF
jgi:hypothetical protein